MSGSRAHACSACVEIAAQRGAPARTQASRSSTGTTGASPPTTSGSDAAIGDDARHAGAERLRRRVAEAFVRRRHGDGRAAACSVEQLFARHVAAQLDAIGDAEALRQRGALLRVRRLRPDRHEPRAGQLRQRANQELQILAPLDRADREDRAAVAPFARQLDEIRGDARVDDAHALRIEAVETREQCAARELRIDDDARCAPVTVAARICRSSSARRPARASARRARQRRARSRRTAATSSAAPSPKRSAVSPHRFPGRGAARRTGPRERGGRSATDPNALRKARRHRASARAARRQALARIRRFR